MIMRTLFYPSEKRWSVVDLILENDISFGYPGIPSTRVLFKNRKSGRIITRSFPGHWPVKDFV